MSILNDREVEVLQNSLQALQDVKLGEKLNAFNNNATSQIYIDCSRVDSYIENGTINFPYKKISTAFAAITGVASVYLAPGVYTETSNLTMPPHSITIFGNNSTLNITNILVTNDYTGYDLNVITSGTETFSGVSATTRFTFTGGSRTGNVTLTQGLLDMKSCHQYGHTINVTGGQLMAIVSIFTSVITQSGGVILLQNNNFNSNKSTALITSTAGQLILVNNLVSNLSTGGGISCNNGATTIPNIIGNNFIVTASGVSVATGTAATIFTKNAVTVAPTGTGFLPVAADMLGNTTIMALGSDATGDIYYRNAFGLLTRLPIGSTGQTLKVTAGLPAWVT